MILSKTTTYALRILIFMASGGQVIYSAQSLFENLGISERYLRRLLTTLVKSGFIISAIGRNGGYVFSRPVNSIYVSDVIEAIEGLESFEGCILGVKNCGLAEVCAMHRAFASIKNNLVATFKQISLAELKTTDL
jgi:Rrf2 family transcriptional regulator, iron-sulfur cluster assembly transcription factor